MTANLWNLIEPSLEKYSDNPAWICRQSGGNRIVSYLELYNAALANAQKLRGLGITAGDTVGITAPNGPEWCAAALAIWKIGAIVAPIHIGNSEQDIASQIGAVKPAAMMVHNASGMDGNCLEITMQADNDAISEESDLASCNNVDGIAVRIYTSGSTGSPKIVRLSHANHASNMFAACNIKSFTPDDRFISLLPFSHAMGLTANLLLPLHCGCTIVSPRVLAASEVLATLEQENISVVIAVPRLFRNIMNGLEKKFSGAGPGLRAYIWMLRRSPMLVRRKINAPIRKKLGGNIKAWVSGGSHLDSRISDYFHGLGLPLRQGYGLTETSPLACIQDEFDNAVQSVGRPIENVQVRILNPGPEGSGEVCIKGPNVMVGYESDEHNSDAFDDGWFKTGDIGRLDDAGRVTLTGRSKRLIVTDAGKNVYPEELETLLERDPGITEAGVFELDMKPVCVVSTDLDNPESAVRQILVEFNRSVSSHNRITRFAITDELPRTPLGKLALQQLPEVFEHAEVGKPT